jgi:serine protease Do
MNTKPLKPFFWVVNLFLIISLSCSFLTTPDPTAVTPTEETQATREPVPTVETVVTSPASSKAVSTLEDVELAVIQIEAEGTFVDPEVGWLVNVGSRGSGFIISPDGIAVTNNHVVTGAALLRVWVKGETRPRNARILGVSECSDLAVIQITNASDLPYLEWYEGQIRVGLDVYAAGFPLGDPEYTLTRGIVSKARAGGESVWASVDNVIEHSARINPGNSGGPLVDSNGKLVGVNYAGASQYDQYFAITGDEAIPVIQQLQAGKDVDTIGINGITVYGTVAGYDISGVWVRSIAPGSPADKARIQSGDILYQLQGQVLATDGSMADYCDILRTRRPSDTMDITIIRWSDLSWHEGQLNGRELDMIGYLDSGYTPDPDPGGSGEWVNDGCWYNEDGNLSCLDDTDSLYIEVPYDWLDYNGGQWLFYDETIGVAISSAPDLSDFNNYWTAPGVFFGASATFAKYGGYVEFLDIYTADYRGSCTLGGRYDYSDGLYRGKYDFYYNCGGPGGYDGYVLSAVSQTNRGAYIIIMLLQVSKGDTWTRDLIWDTFFVGEL